jgi:nicotinate-nucleotide--dimethylbenzimidazole phosphoribosyltransferase
MQLLQQTLAAIRPTDKAVMAAAQKEIDYCLKPPGSLGKLEDIARQIAGITGRIHNAIHKKAIIIMMADNGVCREGIAMYPQDITRIGADFVTSGRMGGNFLANYAGADIIAVDIGIQVDVDLPKVINRKIRYGTANFLVEPAMTREEAVRALEVGIEVTNTAIDQGYDPMHFINMLFTGYSRCLYIDTGVDKERCEALSQDFAKTMNLRHESRRCDLRLLEEGIRKAKKLAP